MNYQEIHDSIHSQINRYTDGVAFSFAVCIATHLSEAGKAVEAHIAAICDRARQLVNEDELSLSARRARIEELCVFEDGLDVGVPVSLLAADTDKVKSYVFESAKLPEVRGASIILELLNIDKVKQQIFTGQASQPPPECLIYNAGGGLLAIVPTCWAKRIANEIERLYLDETKVATITPAVRPFRLCEFRFGLRADRYTFAQFQQQWVDTQPDTKTKHRRILMEYYGLDAETDDADILQERFVETKGFGELVRQMTTDLKAAKQQKQFVPKFESGGFVRTCNSCESRPAITSETIEEDEPVYLCQVCYQKRDVGRKQKVQLVNQSLIEYFKNEGTESAKEFFGTHTRIAAPRDLRELGACSRPRGFVGVIYADGDSVGKLLESLQTPAEYQRFSQKMDEATKNAVFGTIVQRRIKPVRPIDSRQYEQTNRRIELIDIIDNQELVRQEAEDEHNQFALHVHSFEAISVGGDDLVLIVPGHHALWTALEICEGFGEEMKKDDITMSAGVVINSDSYPIYYLFDIAGQLLKSAKKESRESGEGAIDFMVMTAQNTLSSQVSAYRSAFMHRRLPEEGGSLQETHDLTARPYRLSELRNLLCWAEKFKKGEYPTSQLYGLVQSLQDRARQHATLRYLYQSQRQRSEHAELLHGFLDSWNADARYVPWLKKSTNLNFDEYVTHFVDLLEIYQFIRTEGESYES